MDNSNNVREISRYVEQDDKLYEVIHDPAEYGLGLKRSRFRSIKAVKKGYAVARLAIDPEHIFTYDGSGGIESETIAPSGSYILTKTDSDGIIMYDEYGHTNTWFVSEKVLNERYDIPKGGITETTIIKPKRIEQEFVLVDKNVALMKPWGADGNYVPQLIAAGGYINITNPEDVYGVTESNFNDMYTVVKEVIVGV